MPIPRQRILFWRATPCMSNYRRAYVPGACYFFTVNLADRASRLLVDRIESLRNAFCATRLELPFRMEAVAVLPEHLHCIWTLPPCDSDFSSRWQRIKSRFAGACPAEESRSVSRARKRERGIWQRRFWEHQLRDERDVAAHIDYIHYNPVKHGHVLRAGDWPYSSFHRFVREGVLPADWAVDGEHSGDFGERLSGGSTNVVGIEPTLRGLTRITQPASRDAET